MLGLPESTELNKQLPKNAIYAKFNLSNTEKERMDNDISKITIVNEVSPSRTGISPGNEIKSFFVLLITLKQKKFDEKSIITISKLIPQNMILILEYGSESRLAVYRSKLIKTDWHPNNTLKIELKGLDFDSVWENIIKNIGSGNWNENLSLDENIARHERDLKIKKDIEHLKRKLNAEKQPKKKFEIFSKIKELEELLNDGKNI